MQLVINTFGASLRKQGEQIPRPAPATSTWPSPPTRCEHPADHRRPPLDRRASSWPCQQHRPRLPRPARRPLRPGLANPHGQHRGHPPAATGGRRRPRGAGHRSSNGSGRSCGTRPSSWRNCAAAAPGRTACSPAPGGHPGRAGPRRRAAGTLDEQRGTLMGLEGSAGPGLLRLPGPARAGGLPFRGPQPAAGPGRLQRHAQLLLRRPVLPGGEGVRLRRPRPPSAFCTRTTTARSRSCST